MAVTQALLTADASATDATSYVTASVSPTANRLLLLAVASSDHNTAAPTVTGNGLTWVEVHTRTFGFSGTFDRRRVTVFRAMGASPSAGAVTILFDVSDLATGCAWVLSEFDGMDTSGTNGSGAIVQVDGTDIDTAVTTLTVTLAAFASATNATWGAFFSGTTITPGTDFTQIAEALSTPSPSYRLLTEWRNVADTTVDASWASTSWTGAVVIEIAEAAGALVSLLVRRPVLPGLIGR